MSPTTGYRPVSSATLPDAAVTRHSRRTAPIELKCLAMTKCQRNEGAAVQGVSRLLAQLADSDCDSNVTTGVALVSPRIRSLSVPKGCLTLYMLTAIMFGCSASKLNSQIKRARCRHSLHQAQVLAIVAFSANCPTIA